MAYTWSNYSDLTRVPGPPNQEVDEEGELGRPFFLNILSTLGRQNTLESSGWLVMFNSGLPEPAETPHSSIAHAY